MQRYKLFPIVAALLAVFLAACQPKFVIPDPVSGGGTHQQDPDPDPGSGEDPDPDPNEGTTPEPPPPPQPLDPTPGPVVDGMLRADGNDALTYDLIISRGYNFEAPDESGAHAQDPFRHVRQRHDEVLGRPVFDFYLHIQNDDDRGKTDVTDRQRNEIKTDGHSPASLVAQEGETMRYTWKFCLPVGMKTTSKFSHIHQLKGIDNSAGNADVSMPLITFTCRSVSGGQQLQVIFVSPTDQGSKSTTLGTANLKDFLGEWVSVTETVTFSTSGTYDVKIVRMRDQKTLLTLNRSNLWLWREGTTGLRPKWGLYRNFGEGRSLASQLRDEVLTFNDFLIEKL